MRRLPFLSQARQRRATSLAEVILAMAVFSVVALGIHGLVVQGLHARQRMAWRASALSTANAMLARADAPLQSLQQMGGLPGVGQAVVLLEGTDQPQAEGAAGPSLAYQVTVTALDDTATPALRLESLAYPLREDGGSTQSLAARVVTHRLPPAASLPLQALPEPTPKAPEVGDGMEQLIAPAPAPEVQP